MNKSHCRCGVGSRFSRQIARRTSSNISGLVPSERCIRRIEWLVIARRCRSLLPSAASTVSAVPKRAKLPHLSHSTHIPGNVGPPRACCAPGRSRISQTGHAAIEVFPHFKSYNMFPINRRRGTCRVRKSCDDPLDKARVVLLDAVDARADPPARHPLGGITAQINRWQPNAYCRCGRGNSGRAAAIR
jgi:hypothetical protein